MELAIAGTSSNATSVDPTESRKGLPPLNPFKMAAYAADLVTRAANSKNKNLALKLITPAIDMANFADEVEDRIDAYERGELKAIPGEEVFRRLKPRKKRRL